MSIPAVQRMPAEYAVIYSPLWLWLFSVPFRQFQRARNPTPKKPCGRSPLLRRPR